MSFALIAHSLRCSPENTPLFGLLTEEYEKQEASKGVLDAKVSEIIFTSTIPFDALVSISLMAVGILGALSMIHISPAAVYSMIGVSGTIILADASVPIVIKIRGKYLKSQLTKNT